MTRGVKIVTIATRRLPILRHGDAADSGSSLDGIKNYFSSSSASNVAGPSHGLIGAPAPPTFDNLEALLRHHSAKTISALSEQSLTLIGHRMIVFGFAVTSFYKRAISDPQKLHRSLVVNFCKHR